MDSFCFNRSNLLIIILIIIIIAMIFFFFFFKNKNWGLHIGDYYQPYYPEANYYINRPSNMNSSINNSSNNQLIPENKNIEHPQTKTTIINNERNDINVEISNRHIPVDVIRNYDYNKIVDPLIEPTRRMSRYAIPPYYLKRILDYPTRGYPDNFIQQGILVQRGDLLVSNENKILRLFGRQEFPGSNRHEYYIMVNSGLDQIKIPIRSKHQKELNDGDHVYIKELNEDYKVSLYKNDALKYYPDVL